MAKAKPVRNLSCDGAAPEEGRKILHVRLDELKTHRDLIKSENDSVALHDLRISAKRLRYSLETFEFCYPGTDVDSMADQVRAMQDILGRIHDLDVMMSILLERVDRIDASVRDRAFRLARETGDVQARNVKLRELVSDDQDNYRRLGVYEVVGEKARERAEKYEQFVSLWNEWNQGGVIGEIEALLEDG
ncbi:MAG: hypothetical protein NVS2B16_16120 [Chloroflexota bacterium]